MKKLFLAGLIILVAGGVIAATTWDMSWPRLDQLWIGDTDDTPSNTLTTNSLYVKGDIELDGTLYPSSSGISGLTRYVHLPILSFSHNGSADITASTAPGIESDDSITAIVWADGEATPIQTTFTVPPDYSSGGSFRVFATESDSSTPNQIDFDVYINGDGVAADASATNQTPVALAGTTSTGDMVTLTVATDFASLAAGDVVTFRMWRDDTADGTGDLESKDCWFAYTPKY